MPKVLLSKLPDAIANTLAALRDGLENAGGDGIVAKVIDNRVDLQVEVVIDVNGIERTQLQSSLGTTRTVSGGAEVTTQVSGTGVSTQVDGGRTSTGSESGTESGSESGNESGSASENSSGTQQTSGNANMSYTYNA